MGLLLASERAGTSVPRARACAGHASASFRPPPSTSVSSCLYSGYTQAEEA